MTESRKTLNIVHIVRSTSWNEYRVPSPDGDPLGTYFTDDKQDAIDTAKALFGDDVNVRIRSVND